MRYNTIDELIAIANKNDGVLKYNIFNVPRLKALSDRYGGYYVANLSTHRFTDKKEKEFISNQYYVIKKLQWEEDFEYWIFTDDVLVYELMEYKKEAAC